MLVKSGLLKLLGNIILPYPYYPIGRIILTMSSADNPNSIYKGQTWKLIAKGRTLVGIDENDPDFNEINKIGGEKKHTLTIEEMPKHNHNQSLTDNGNRSGWAGYDFRITSTSRDYNGSDLAQYSGGNKPHNNMPPYITCYIWQRIS